MDSHTHIRFGCLLMAMGLAGGLVWLQTRPEPTIRLTTVDRPVIIAIDGPDGKPSFSYGVPAAQAQAFMSDYHPRGGRYLFIDSPEYNEASVMPLEKRWQVPGLSPAQRISQAFPERY